jgi:hypothetical protein
MELQEVQEYPSHQTIQSLLEEYLGKSKSNNKKPPNS